MELRQLIDIVIGNIFWEKCSIIRWTGHYIKATCKVLIYQPTKIYQKAILMV